MRLLGFLDHLSASGIFGWAVDQDQQESPILIDASSNGELKFSLFSALPREDVRRAGFARDRSGFFGRLPVKLLDGSLQRLQFGVENSQLNYSPAEFRLSARTFVLDRSPSVLQRLRSELRTATSPIEILCFTRDSMDGFALSSAIEVAREICGNKTVVVAETRGRSLFRHSIHHLLEAGLSELVIRPEGHMKMATVASDVSKWKQGLLSTRWVRSWSGDLKALDAFLSMSVDEAIQSGSRILEIEAEFDLTLHQRAAGAVSRALTHVEVPLAIQFSWIGSR